MLVYMFIFYNSEGIENTWSPTVEPPKFCTENCFCLKKVGKVLLAGSPEPFSLIGFVTLQCLLDQGWEAPGCLEVIVEVVGPLLTPFWQSCSRSHAADLEIHTGRNAGAMFV